MLKVNNVKNQKNIRYLPFFFKKAQAGVASMLFLKYF